MRVTFLIGNGFDINLGLNTRYKDFIDVYKKPNENDDVIIKTFKNHLVENKENWSDAELAFGKYTKEYDVTIEDADRFLDCHENFCENLANYLKTEDSRISFNDNVCDVFLFCINSILDEIGSLRIESLFGNKEFNMRSETNYFNFISFNYTNVLDYIVNNTMKDLECNIDPNENSLIEEGVIHAHGKTDGTMVLGVNDVSQLDKDIFDDCPNDYRAQVIKPDFHMISEEDYSNEIHEKLMDTDVIFIYGMSLGETDKRWWQSIISILEEYEDKSLFIHYYDNQKKPFFNNRRNPSDESIRDKFLSYSKCEQSTKEKLKKRIVIIRENIFEELKDTIIYRKPSGKIHISDLI